MNLKWKKYEIIVTWKRESGPEARTLQIEKGDSSISYRIFETKQFLKDVNKIKGKLAPILELVANEPKALTINEIHELKGDLKNYFLFIVNNHVKQPKKRFFLALRLASQSSDLLVSLASNYARANGLKLVQYSINPKIYRISLLTLKEVKTIEGYSQSVEVLKDFRTNFRNKLAKLKNLVEDK